MDYSRWMSLDKTIHNKRLANICLPMTRNTGTFDLSDLLAPDPGFLPELETRLAEIAKILNDSGILPYRKDPLEWMLEESIGAIKGLTVSTNENIATQLRMGIRGFDFRILNKDGVYYTYNGLQSKGTFASMLDELRAFLVQTTKSGEAVGEIVYVNLSHYLKFASSNDYKNFGAFVKQKLGDFAYRNLGANDPFKAPYKEIISQGGQYKSRVILATDTPLGDEDTFWPAAWCVPDDNRNQTVIVGKYTDATEVDKVVKGQVSHFKTAIGAALPTPFANYMTLTPSTGDSVNIILSSLHHSFAVLAKDLAEEGFEDLAAIVDGIALSLEVDVLATEALGWRTLEQLSHRIDKDLPELVDDNFVPLTGKTNQISMIFTDFWETTQVVDLSIGLSNDLEMKWLGNNPIKVGASQPSSTEGPTAAMYRGLLHMFYKGRSTNDIWSAVYDPLKKMWLSGAQIINLPGGRAVNPQTNKSPCAAVYKDILYVVYKSASDNTICMMSWDGSTWNGGAPIKISGGTNPQTNNSPYLALYKDELFLVHKWKDSDDIHCSRFNGTWSGGSRIEVTDNKDQKYPGTNRRPALVEFGGLLYLFFKGSHSNNLLQCTYDGTQWKGNLDIKVKSDKFKPKSSEGPGVARFAGNIDMLYKGETYERIWLSVFNGVAWGENIDLEKVTSIKPKSDRSPWVVRVGVDLFLLNKGDNDNIYQSTLTPVRF
jgi:hypothetical protein